MAQLKTEAARGAIVVVATHDSAVFNAADRHFILDDGVLTDYVEPIGHLQVGFGG